MTTEQHSDNVEWIKFEGNFSDLKKIENLIGLEITFEFEREFTGENPRFETIRKTILIGHEYETPLYFPYYCKIIQYRRVYDPTSTPSIEILSSRSNLFKVQALTEEQNKIKLIIESNNLIQDYFYIFATENYYSTLRSEETPYEKLFSEYNFTFYKTNDEYDSEMEGYWTTEIVYNFTHKITKNEIYLRSFVSCNSWGDNKYNPFEFVNRTDFKITKWEEISPNNF